MDPDTTVLFSYEEALGYCIGGVVHDKDGISGAITFTEMMNEVFCTRGLTLNGYLQYLYTEYGQFQSNNSYVICHDPVVIGQIFVRLRSCGSTDLLMGYLDHCGGVKVNFIRDVTKGKDINAPVDLSPLPATPGSEMLMFSFDNGCTVTLRTSGTEPKIKYYIEMGGQRGMTSDQVSSELSQFSDIVINELLQPNINKFG